jgi:hypothetical protein
MMAHRQSWEPSDIDLVMNELRPLFRDDPDDQFNEWATLEELEDDCRSSIKFALEENREHIDNGCAAAVAAAERLAQGDSEVYGFPTLKDRFGEAVAKKIAKHLDYRGSKDNSTNDQGFETDGDGKLLKSQSNIRTAIELIGVELSYDAFQDRGLVEGLDGHTMIDDPAVEKMWLTIDERFRLLPNKDFFYTVVDETARRNTFHPVCDYLNALKWDGVPRLDKWLVTYCGANDTEYTRAVGAITMIAAVRRVMHPGIKFDEMLILEGHQGSERSTLIAAFTPDPSWFSDNLPLNADSKIVIERTSGKWIIEAPELSGMRKADVEHLKAMLSRQTDSARLAYGRKLTDRPRHFIVIGTTNADTYLRDPTGNRRYWPVKINKVDLPAMRRDRDHLWAEAAAREASGESIRLKQELWEKAAIEQQEREVIEPWEELIGGVIGDLNGKILSADIWKIVGIDPAHRTQEHNTRIGNTMKALGFKRDKLRFGGDHPERCYVRGTKLDRIHFYRNRNSEWRASITSTKDEDTSTSMRDEF